MAESGRKQIATEVGGSQDSVSMRRGAHRGDARESTKAHLVAAKERGNGRDQLRCVPVPSVAEDGVVAHHNFPAGERLSQLHVQAAHLILHLVLLIENARLQDKDARTHTQEKS